MLEATSTVLGAGDCEAFHDGWLIQPVNAWTSLAYAAVGIVLMVSANTVSGQERAFRITFGGLLVATGIGSFLYHGPQPPLAGFAHDITFLAALWFLIIMNPSLRYGLRSRWAWGAFAAVSFVIAVVLALSPTATNWLAGVSIIALIVSDLLMHRIGGIDGRWYAAALLLLAASLLLNVLGRSGAPTCEPRSLLQAHGLWHALSAAALGAYAIATIAPRDRESTS